MSTNSQIKVALIGNPNTGKTTLFNQLTGLKQKVGNYPGVTVDKKLGLSQLTDGYKAEITDLPGTYSINPTSMDEGIVLQTLLDSKFNKSPDVLLVVAEIENLKRNLLLFSQMKDLEIPIVLVINMSDQMERKGISLDIKKLEKLLGNTVVLISARRNQGIDKVKSAIVAAYERSEATALLNISQRIDKGFFQELQQINTDYNIYELWLMLTQNVYPSNLSKQDRDRIIAFRDDVGKLKQYQHKETIYRYQQINSILKECYVVDTTKAKDTRSRLDRIFTHKIFGYVLFVAILLTIFQSIFDWASLPMDFIDEQFANLSGWVKNQLPSGVLNDLISDGIVPGIGGVVIFIPQIAILFMFISILEETGYMSRVVFLMDKIMRKFGLSGKSIIPLISGTACAIPAIMATRNISGWKERLITILVTPFTTCSARLPVYAILIALIIPNTKVLGFLNLQGLTLLLMYVLGFASAVIAAAILHKTLKIKSRSFFVAEMPDYKIPSFKNVAFEVVEKTKAFVFGAGKIILSISIVLWFLASNGPESFEEVETNLEKNTAYQNLSQEEKDKKLASLKLAESYIGITGKFIEPVIKPLGYDWKIGIALITSFAAREVFVGTLATIYSVENNDEDIATIKQRLEAEVNPETGEKRFTFPVGMSLLIFYAFAMQCMATLAIVKRETKSWKWPIIQLFGMGLLAYFSAMIVFQILS